MDLKSCPVSDAEFAAQLRKLLNAYPLGTMDRPLDVMTAAAEALERRAPIGSAPKPDEGGRVDLPLEDARQEHIEMMVKAAADWLASDDTAYEIAPDHARRAAWGMLQAAFSVVPGPNVVKGPVDMRGSQDVKR